MMMMRRRTAFRFYFNDSIQNEAKKNTHRAIEKCTANSYWRRLALCLIAAPLLPRSLGFSLNTVPTLPRTSILPLQLVWVVSTDSPVTRSEWLWLHSPQPPLIFIWNWVDVVARGPWGNFKGSFFTCSFGELLAKLDRVRREHGWVDELPLGTREVGMGPVGRI